MDKPFARLPIFIYIILPRAIKVKRGFLSSISFFSLFLRSYLITSQPDSPSSSPALQHPGSVCQAIPYSAFSPAEPSPVPPGRRFYLALFPIFFLFPLRFLLFIIFLFFLILLPCIQIYSHKNHMYI